MEDTLWILLTILMLIVLLCFVGCGTTAKPPQRIITPPMPPMMKSAIIAKSLGTNDITLIRTASILQWPPASSTSSVFVVQSSVDLSNWVDVARMRENYLIITNLWDSMFYKVWEEKVEMLK